MTRDQRDREDLLAEATALVERIALCWPGQHEEVVVGFRHDSSASVYFGAEPVYHFNSRGQLRRAYADGLLFKALAGRLVSLRRQRTAEAVELLSHVLEEQPTRTFLETIHRRLADLAAAIELGQCRTIGQVPSDADVIGRVRRWFAGLPAVLEIAATPHAR